MPQSSYFNPGSTENARLSFEDQNDEANNFQAGNQAERSALFEGYQSPNLIEKEAATPNENEAQEFQNEFLTQSEVQKSRLGDFVANPGSDVNTAQFNKLGMPEVKQNPFEMPAGYPVEDGYKKSIVAKQNLPFNEPHPGKIFPYVVIILRMCITYRNFRKGIQIISNSYLDIVR